MPLLHTNNFSSDACMSSVKVRMHSCLEFICFTDFCHDDQAPEISFTF